MQYLTIIRKAEFVDLFKYGHLYVRRVTAFDGDIQNLKDDVAKFKEVTSDMNLFEYSFEYLMLHISVEQEISCNPEIELSDVRGVYVFNEEAKKRCLSHLILEFRYMYLHGLPCLTNFRRYCSRSRACVA